MELTIDVFESLDRATLSRLARIHMGMMRRCYDKKHCAYKYYGARGISICAPWKKNRFWFYAWALTNGYSAGLTIDRIDNDRGYEPGNVQWATRRQQVINRRPRGTNGVRSLIRKASQFIGVARAGKKWCARIRVGNKRAYIGTFSDEESAARAYDEKVRELHGIEAFVNFPIAKPA